MQPSRLAIFTRVFATSATLAMAYLNHGFILDETRILTEFLARMAGR